MGRAKKIAVGGVEADGGALVRAGLAYRRVHLQGCAEAHDNHAAVVDKAAIAIQCRIGGRGEIEGEVDARRPRVTGRCRIGRAGTRLE